LPPINFITDIHYFYFVIFNEHTISRIVIPAGIAGIQAPWMDLSLPSMALDTRFLAGMTSLRIIELRRSGRDSLCALMGTGIQKPEMASYNHILVT
jgi:hypothetical protein